MSATVECTDHRIHISQGNRPLPRFGLGHASLLKVHMHGVFCLFSTQQVWRNEFRWLDCYFGVRIYSRLNKTLDVVVVNNVVKHITIASGVSSCIYHSFKIPGLNLLVDLPVAQASILVQYVLHVCEQFGAGLRRHANSSLRNPIVIKLIKLMLNESSASWQQDSWQESRPQDPTRPTCFTYPSSNVLAICLLLERLCGVFFS